MTEHETAPPSSAGEGITLVINLSNGEAREAKAISLASVGLKERADLQRWIAEHPRVVGENLLLLTSEFDQWENRAQKVSDRLDLLFRAVAFARPAAMVLWIITPLLQVRPRVHSGG